MSSYGRSGPRRGWLLGRPLGRPSPAGSAGLIRLWLLPLELSHRWNWLLKEARLPVLLVITVPPRVSLVLAQGTVPEQGESMPLTEVLLSLIPLSLAEDLSALGALEGDVFGHLGVIWASQHTK